MLLLVFSLDERNYALGLGYVERVARAVEVTPHPTSPEVVSGMVNLHGEIVPVMNLRNMLRLPEKEIDLSDHLIIARSSIKHVGFLADSVSGVIECSENQVIKTEGLDSQLGYTEGVIKLDGVMAVILDLNRIASRMSVC